MDLTCGICGTPNMDTDCMDGTCGLYKRISELEHTLNVIAEYPTPDELEESEDWDDWDCDFPKHYETFILYARKVLKK